MRCLLPAFIFIILAADFAVSPAVFAQESAQAALIPKNVDLKTSGNWKAGEIRRGPNGKLYLAKPAQNAGGDSGKPPLAIPGPEVRLHWSAPRFRVDGKPLRHLAGYKILYGSRSGHYSHSVDIGKRTSYALKGLTPGKVYFIAVSAYLPSGIESAPSNEVKVVIGKASAGSPP